MDLGQILDILQTVGICGGAILLAITAFFLMGVLGDLETLIARCKTT